MIKNQDTEINKNKDNGRNLQWQEKKSLDTLRIGKDGGKIGTIKTLCVEKYCNYFGKQFGNIY